MNYSEPLYNQIRKITELVCKSFKNYFLELFFMSSQLPFKTRIRFVLHKFHLFFQNIKHKIIQLISPKKN